MANKATRTPHRAKTRAKTIIIAPGKTGVQQPVRK